MSFPPGPSRIRNPAEFFYLRPGRANGAAGHKTLIFGFSSHQISAVTVKIVSHRVDAAFFFAPVGKTASFRKLQVDMDDVSVEVSVFTFMLIEVACLGFFWEPPIIESGEFFIIEFLRKLIGTLPCAPFPFSLITVLFQPHHIVSSVGDGAIAIVYKPFLLCHVFRVFPGNGLQYFFRYDIRFLC